MALGAGLWAFWPYVTYYAALWLHSPSVYPTLAVFVAYAVLLVRSATARRLVLLVLDVVTLGAVGSAIAALRRP